MVFISPYLENCVEKMALNAKVSAGSLGDRMVAVSSRSQIRLWSFTHNDGGYVKFEIGMYRAIDCSKLLGVPFNFHFFTSVVIPCPIHFPFTTL